MVNPGFHHRCQRPGSEVQRGFDGQPADRAGVRRVGVVRSESRDRKRSWKLRATWKKWWTGIHRNFHVTRIFQDLLEIVFINCPARIIRRHAPGNPVGLTRTRAIRADHAVNRHPTRRMAVRSAQPPAGSIAPHDRRYLVACPQCHRPRGSGAIRPGRRPKVPVPRCAAGRPGRHARPGHMRERQTGAR